MASKQAQYTDKNGVMIENGHLVQYGDEIGIVCGMYHIWCMIDDSQTLPMACKCEVLVYGCELPPAPVSKVNPFEDNEPGEPGSARRATEDVLYEAMITLTREGHGRTFDRTVRKPYTESLYPEGDGWLQYRQCDPNHDFFPRDLLKCLVRLEQRGLVEHWRTYFRVKDMPRDFCNPADDYTAVMEAKAQAAAVTPEADDPAPETTHDHYRRVDRVTETVMQYAHNYGLDCEEAICHLQSEIADGNIDAGLEFEVKDNIIETFGQIAYEPTMRRRGY